MTKHIVSALQIGAKESGKQETLQSILSYENEIIQSKSELVVMPEALLGGYPKGETFGTYLGYRLDAGREAYERYYANAVNVPGEETDELVALSQRTQCSIVIGVIERAGSTLYCTSLHITPSHGLVGKHRKLMPTGTERLIWGQGDGSMLSTVDTGFAKIGSAICWENHMPLLRMAMYAQGIDIWCAPTVDEREIWQCSMRHIAHEGRCFVISAVQVQGSPEQTGRSAEGWDPSRPFIKGGSMIVDPLGNILAGPMYGEEGLLSVEIDMSQITKSRYDFDVVGHYARPDVFSLQVDVTAKKSVTLKS
ncbi:carbon-nitrogen hydrolase family protein [Shewanella sp. A32]|uniref:carbon-nitrogen hydrolase family protein n=1 Tax=Shewanella sp. A32 TaxID=3031327 RepID=UPI0023B9C090|nr:carbon-nitrogen hydrolase family protein [Shewanella sp. A32]MDF0534027.1 carbon-nitrogen hydrolase family protein [Shewanella sp. A32]